MAANGSVGRKRSRLTTTFALQRRNANRLRPRDFARDAKLARRWLDADVRVQPERRLRSKAIDRAAHAKRATIEHVRVHHRRTDVRVAEQLLHGPDVVPILEQVRCE